MKRWIAVLFVLVMLLGTSLISFGAMLEKKNVEVVDGISSKKQSVPSVNLLMGGKDIYTDVPSVLYTIKGKSRTLVPIRFVVEELGADIGWNQATREATINNQGKKVVLKIDHDVAVVNGVKVKLPNSVPPKLLGYEGKYRTMVPLRFIAEQFNMDVNWIQETVTATVDFPKQSILDIAYDHTKNIPQLEIKTTGFVNVETMYLQGSKYGGNDRLVLDIPNADLKMSGSSFEESNGLIKKNINRNGIRTIRASLFEEKPRHVSRVVVDLDHTKGYNVHFDQDTSSIKVEFLNSVKNIKLEKRNGVNTVVIRTEETPIYNVMDLGNKVVVDVLNAKLKYDKNEIFIGQGGVKKVRTAQFNPDENYSEDDQIVRVVLDLEDGQKFENIFVDNEEADILVYMNDKPLQAIDYQKQDPNNSRLKITLEEKDEYQVNYSMVSNEVVLKVLKSKVELDHTMLDIKDNMVESININDQINDEYYYVNIKLSDGADYEVETKETVADEVIISFKNKVIESSNYNKKLVVIDAGHGGKDPGAMSNKLKLKEKDLALDTARRLETLLQEAGFATYMIRSEDEYVGLYKRPELANGLNADVFVSIHYNWVPNKDITGVEVLYNGDDPYRDNKTFAKIVQSEMVKGLNAKDRGIVHRPKLVVIRETKMPAILTEMGFMSNPTEESKMNTEAYRQKCAQVLFNGIQRYFDEVLLK